ncbi:MAG: hypothetical protein GWN30_19755 [Gammaproteobacteria bacterium]|nr:hypothetical protein [Gammaproteobacteria bacterium]
MSNQKENQKLTKAQQNPGLFTGMSRTFRLVLRLLADPRVNILLKILPISSLAYFILPLPLDAAIPLIDDAVILGLGTYVFIELCPPDVVEEHQAKLAGWTEPQVDSDDEDEIIEPPFNEIDQ